jgi:hypothetical protein
MPYGRFPYTIARNIAGLIEFFGAIFIISVVLGFVSDYYRRWSERRRAKWPEARRRESDRKKLAAFLERLADGKVQKAEWTVFVHERFEDTRTETIRLEVAGLAKRNRQQVYVGAVHVQRLRQLAEELKRDLG